jgi:hypothetical protein
MSAPIEQVLQTEHQHLRQRRGEPPAPASADPLEDAHHLKPFGVSFSGGGIRSATFNLGIIQGLAESNLLSRIDYLSTVSGGGYIGSWLHGFIKNHCEGDLERASNRLSPTDHPVPESPHDDPVTFLRKYSNYLAPRPGLFSADTWVIGTIWLRNVFLNQLILIPALSAVVLAAFLFYFVQQWPVAQYFPNIPFYVMPVVAVVLLAITLPFAIKNLSEIVKRCGLDELAAPRRDGKSPASPSTRADSWLVPALIFAAAVVLGTGDTGVRIEGSVVRWSSGLALLGAMFFVLLFVLQTFGGFRNQYKQTHEGMTGATFWRIAHPLWMSALCAALMVVLLHLLWTSDRAWNEWARVTLGPPLVSLGIMISVSVLIGLMGADYPDGAREWLARTGALLTLVSVAWLVVFGISFYGPYAVAYALGEYGKTTMAGIAAWIATGAAGVFAGSSSRTGGEPDEAGKSSVLDRLVGLAPPLVMVAYLLLVSLGVHQLFAATLNIPSRPRDALVSEALQVDVRVPPPAEPVEIKINRSAVPGVLESLFADAKAFAAGYHDVFTKGEDVERRLARLALLLFGSLLIAGIASARININEFSLHNFYKNRLVRCYLGASNASRRQPNRFTGFDPQDDFALSELVPDRGYRGPYPIVNTTLNLNVGSELSQQERKGASFVMTPAFCGFDVQASSAEPPADEAFETFGYRQTRADGDEEMGYSDPKGPTVGQGMAISGAAASPNAGYTTSGPMAFLLTIFDARLGWWLGNPRWRDASRLSGPPFALKYLLAELIGNTTARTRFVNLSDGGHFENLGLYELVRRRCRYIIVCDGEQDGKLTFGSLGGAVRKCRADFGVEINIDPTPIKLTHHRSSAHCVIGTIIYPEFDPVPPVPMSKASAGLPPNVQYADVQPPTKYARGWLLYLKSSLTGNEPADVVQYQAENPEFPHESTGDQFFTESQFESYRRLGLHIFREAFEGVVQPRIPGEPRPAAPPTLTALFQQLTMKWYARIPIEASAASRLNDSYSEMVKRLGDQNLSSLLGGSLASPSGPPPWAAGQPSDPHFVYIVEQLQLMENVFFEFQFEHRAHRANPRSRGWMTIFRQWVHSPAFDGVWERVRHSYNPVFQDFITRLQSEPIDDVPIQN